ncbi:hypothetical protein F6X68_23440 [Micromonospora sp. AMSO12t]|uniref:PHB depolymerase family esterase n=1 Tax=Micromonospora sp. AMSO12t TaxID=2650410 RepID=UPI00124B5FF2|nr:PHB depolymerase family esterase [Micromonospora sp. AMSO12t]KAB1139625.1 hypothetical protein F6X68_23440 [Micromonospora sp. AMSO12t]
MGTGVSPGSRRPRRLRGPSSAPPPATTGSPWRTAGPTAGTCCGTTDDVGFLKDLTAHLVRTWRADPDRVYLIGISNGGDMSFRAAVEGERLFAAIGVVSGGYSGPRTAPETYVPRRPVSVITFIGGQDRYADVFTEGVRTWQRRLRCTPATGAPPAGAPRVTRTGPVRGAAASGCCRGCSA